MSMGGRKITNKTTKKYPLSFVHVGLPKCMSTTLQHLWMTSHNYNYYPANEFNDSIEKTICHHRERAGAVLNSMNINFQPPTHSSNVTVFSSEGFSTLWPNDLAAQPLWGTKQRVIPEFLAAHANKVLLIVRDPVEWIFSSYAQLLKEGRVIELTDYLNDYRDYIAQVLDISNFNRLWTESGFEISVLPMDIIKTEPETYWRTYETQLDLPRPSNYNDKRDGKARNATVTDTLHLQLQLNKLFELLSESVDGIDNPEDFGDLDNVREIITRGKMWASRRALDGINSDQVSRLQGLLDPQTPKISKSMVEIPHELAQHLLLNFVAPLRMLRGWDNLNGLCDRYEDSIATHTSTQSSKVA